MLPVFGPEARLQPVFVDDVAAAIHAAAEQQSAATREIAASVQAVADSTQEITEAMREVRDVATRSGEGLGGHVGVDEAGERAHRVRATTDAGDREVGILPAEDLATLLAGLVTDHRIGLTLHKLPEVLEGPGLGELIAALTAEDQAKRLADASTTLTRPLPSAAGTATGRAATVSTGAASPAAAAALVSSAAATMAQRRRTTPTSGSTEACGAARRRGRDPRHRRHQARDTASACRRKFNSTFAK